MPKADNREQFPLTKSLNNNQHVGKAAQFLLELIKGTQPFFCLADERGIVLEHLEAERIVNVRYLDVMVLQLLPEENVLIAIVSETIVEGVGEHDGAC